MKIIPWCTQKNDPKYSGGQANYHQLLHFRPTNDVSNESVATIDDMFAVIKNSVMNTSLFNRFLNARDSGIFSIGSIIIFVSRKPTKKYTNVLSMVETQNQETLASPTV